MAIEEDGSGSAASERLDGASPGQIFPTLDAAQIARIASLAKERTFADGESLWEQGDRERPLYIVLEGGVAILSGKDQLVTIHEPGGFTGDVDLLSGRQVVGAGAGPGRDACTRVAVDPRARDHSDGRESERNSAAGVHPEAPRARREGVRKRRGHRLAPLRGDAGDSRIPDSQQPALRLSRR